MSLVVAPDGLADTLSSYVMGVKEHALAQVCESADARVLIALSLVGIFGLHAIFAMLCKFIYFVRGLFLGCSLFEIHVHLNWPGKASVEGPKVTNSGESCGGGGGDDGDDPPPGPQGVPQIPQLWATKNIVFDKVYHDKVCRYVRQSRKAFVIELCDACKKEA